MLVAAITMFGGYLPLFFSKNVQASIPHTKIEITFIIRKPASVIF